MAETYPPIDPYLFMAGVKLHLADHQPMTFGDCLAWELCDIAQNYVFAEEMRRG